MLELKLLGIPQLSFKGEAVALPSPKILGLLGYLAVQGEARTRKELLELFWNAGKASNVRFALYKLRELPGAEDWLETTDKFVKTKVVTDVERFEGLVDKGRFTDALSIWHAGDEGDKTFLKGLELTDATPFTNWLELERSRLEQLYLTALQKGIGELERKERLEDALDLAHFLLDKDKLNESAHRAVMRLEQRRGNTEAALAQFEECRQILKDELGVEPLEDTLELLREIEGVGVSSGKNAVLASVGEEVPARPEKLVGRTELLESTLALLKAHKRVLLHGFGGAGKTALAAATAEAHLSSEEGNVLWLQAGDDPPATLFDALARAFGAQQRVSQAKETDKPTIIKALLRQHKVSLFILDDVWNAYALSKVMEAVPETLPLVVTSRQRYPKLKRIDVGRLAREDALELLSHHARSDLNSNLSTNAAADRLCETLGDHAFALRIAGINLRVEAATPATLLRHITDTPHTMKTPPDFNEEGRESVTALLTASLTALPEDAYEAFMGFGVLFTTSSTPELLSLCTRRGEEETEKALFTLQKRGLAERASEPGSDVVTYRVHDLAYSFARTNNHYRLATAQRACQTFLERHQQAFEVLDAELANLLGATQAAANQQDGAYLVGMMRRLVVGNAYFGARGHTPRSFDLLKTSITMAKALDNLEAAHALLANLANTYRELYGNYDAALSAFQEALALAKTSGDTHREIVTLTLIGTTLVQQGSDEAETYLEQAHRLAKRRSDDKALCQVLEHLGFFTGKQGDFERSRSYFLQALQTIERLATAETIPETELARLRFFSLLNLGEAEKGLGRMAEALATRETALEVAERQQNQIWMAYAHQELGETHHALGERERAQQAFHRALDLYERNRAPSALTTLRTFMQAENYALAEEVTSSVSA